MKKLLTLFIAAFSLSTASAAQPDNVILSKVEEEYVFTDDKDAGMVVKAGEKKIYEATLHSCMIRPYIYYNDVITLDKASGGKLQYRNINTANIFHDDSKICFFDAELKSRGAKAKSEFNRTFTDPAYFTKVPLADEYPVREKTVTFSLPPSLDRVELLEVNFPEGRIDKSEITQIDGTRKISYTMRDLPAMCSEKSSPVSLEVDPYVIVKGYFPTTDQLYDFHRARLDVDTVIPDIDVLLAEVLGDATTREEKIAKLYHYVQNKIRYVAYEEGEAGFRPDRPAEILRKQYGDCKGMALLLATMLNRAGVEAHVASIGTRRIPFKISENPSLGATNHMICIAPADGDTLYLDATYEYISSRDIPSSIQGKDAMMFTRDGYKMIDIPRRSCETSSEESVYEYEIKDGALVGTGKQIFKGDLLESLLTTIYGVNRNYKSDVWAIQIKPRRSMKVNQDSIKSGFAGDGIYEVSASGLSDANAVTDTGDAVYVDLTVDGREFVDKIDVADRRTDYKLPFPAKFVNKSILTVPEGYRPGELPEGYHGSCEGVTLDCKYSVTDEGKVSCETVVTVDTTIIPLAKLGEWNRMYAEWKEAATHQIELLKNN